MTLRIAILTLALALVSSSLTSADEPKSDRVALIGTWLLLEYHDDGGDKTGRLTGRAVNTKDKPELLPRLVFTADECYVLRPSKSGFLREVAAGITNCAWKSCQLDEKATPKTIEITAYWNKHDPTGKDLVYPGIYELDGKKLRICYNESPVPGKGPRPAEFKSDGAMNLFVCEKLSDTPEKPVGEFPSAPPK